MVSFSEIAAVRDLLKARLRGTPGITGVGVGAPHLEVGVRIYVEKMTHPVVATLPPHVNGLPVIVVETGLFHARRASRPGQSVGHYEVGAGTLGGVVKDSDGSLLILSNNHVLANEDHRNGAAKQGDPILAPGSVDGGTSSDVVAQLRRWIPLVVSGQGMNSVDCAVAVVSEPTLIESPVTEGQSTGWRGIGDINQHTNVVKTGRTTGLTRGQVLDVDATVYGVGYGDFQADFEHQIMTTVMSKAGDSGSFLLSEDGSQVLGLLFSGSDQVTLYNHISRVRDALGVTFPDWSAQSISGSHSPSTAPQAPSQDQYHTASNDATQVHTVNPVAALLAIAGIGVVAYVMLSNSPRRSR